MDDTLLLVDDDTTMLHILEGILSNAGYSCLTVPDPVHALALINGRPDIALVISDIVMPGMTGIEFVQRMNALELGRDAPRILLLTAQPSLESAVDALRLGVNDFLVKPIRSQELIAAVARTLAQAGMEKEARLARPPQIERLVREAEEFANRLRLIAYSTEAQGKGDDFAQSVEPGEPEVAPPAHPAGTVVHVDSKRVSGAGRRRDTAVPLVLDAIEQLRHLRDRYEEHRLDDIAWDLLLELLRAERLGQRLSVSGLTISISNVSVTTSLRRVNELVARDYISRLPDPDDARRDFVSLTPKANELLADYLVQANSKLDDLVGQRHPPI